MTAVALTRETAIPEFGDNKGGVLPEDLADQKFTNRPRAEAHLLRYLEKFWDTSDAKTRKNA
jgi:hypothetical protein